MASKTASKTAREIDLCQSQDTNKGAYNDSSYLLIEAPIKEIEH